MVDRVGVDESSLNDEADAVCELLENKTGVVMPHSIRILSGSTLSVSVPVVVDVWPGMLAADDVAA